MATPPTRRTKVFISYSHKDRLALERLKVHLTPYLTREVDYWEDTQIRPGTRWYDAIQQAITTAKVAVLLVSADFLASSFITQEEIPRLLAAAQRSGVIILPVILSGSAFTELRELGNLQALNNPATPILRLPPAEQEQEWAQIAKGIRDAMFPPPIPTSTRGYPLHISRDPRQTPPVGSPGKKFPALRAAFLILLLFFLIGVSLIGLGLVGKGPLAILAGSATKTITSTLTATTPVVNFTAYLTDSTKNLQDCTAQGVLFPFNVTLDNTKSNIAVSWNALITDKDSAGIPWATVNPLNSVVEAGQTSSLTLTPYSSICYDLGPPLQSDGHGGYKFGVLITFVGAGSNISGSLGLTETFSISP